MDYIKYVLSVYIILSFSSCSVKHPPLNNPAEAYNYWAKRGIIEMIYSYMEDYIDAVDNPEENKKEQEGMEAFYASFIKDIDNKDIKAIDLNYAAIAEFLNKNNWSDAEKKLLVPLDEKYTTYQFIDDEFFTTTK